MNTESGYTVRLDRFEGPMDLLLHLIRRAELDVTEIALAEVTEQYLGHIESFRRVDVDEAGEFLVVAATLIEIQSRLVNPVEAVEEDHHSRRRERETIDPAAELLQQLLSYKAYRDASAELEARAEDWSKRYGAAKAAADQASLREAVRPDDEVELEDVGLWELAQAFHRIVESVNFERLGEHTVEFDDTPIEVHQGRLVERLRGLGPAGTRDGLGLPDVFEGQTKSQAIGLFLAILELVRQRRIRVYRVLDGGEGAVGEAFDHANIRVAAAEGIDGTDADGGGTGSDEAGA